MLNLPDYRVTQKVYESTRSVIYTGYEKQSEKPVVLKLLQGDYPEPRRLAQFQREYALTKQLAGKPGIIETYNLLPYQNSLLMVLEDFGGISFSQYLRQQERPIPVSEFLPLAISMTKALGEIHQEQIMHKDLTPANIIFNPQTQQIKIIDFGISTQLSREVTTFQNPAGLEGTLAYISPEQTGRMNRVVDYRTDFYSLGATFYQLLSGRAPFTEADPLTLIHAHIARQATPLHELNPAVPESVANIVNKLMAKNAEERYLSTYGLLMDLQKCRQLWTDTSSIPVFSLGQHDLADRLQPPQKLYGRQADISQIMAAFARASQGHTEIMLIAGAPGIGKSSLVQEIYRPITQEKGYFMTGKFEQLQRDRPYTAFIQACRDLAHQLLAETESRLTTWREQLVEALSGNGQLLIDVIPEIELIIGPQEPVPQLSPLEAQNRFGRTFLNFIRVFTTAEHPLAIFLDDLQWADTASLNLLQQLVTGQTAEQHLFIIGAYRDNEVNANHPLARTIHDLGQNELLTDQIRLSPLSLEDIVELLADTLHHPPEIIRPLANLLLTKTNGNPFFLGEFLKSLYQHELIWFELDQGQWQWHLEKIQTRSITDNVVTLLADKVRELAPETQTVLKLAACIGNRFDLNTLAAIYQETPYKTAVDLWPALLDGLVIPLSDAYKLALHEIEGLTDNIRLEYKFAHDRIQQAIYSLLTPSEREETHYQIGQILWQHPEQDSHLFELVNHFNQAKAIINSKQEEKKLAALNYRAAQKAYDSAAFSVAFTYSQMTLALIPDENWQTAYRETLDQHVLAAKTAYLSNEFIQMDALVNIILERTTTTLDKMYAYEVRILAHVTQLEPIKALQITKEALAQLNIKLPENPGRPHILYELLRTRFHLRGQSPSDLANLPAMRDPETLMVIRLISQVLSSAFRAAPATFLLFVFRIIRLSLAHGNAPLSAFAYACYGLVLCGVTGNIDTGYQFGELAHTLQQTFQARDIQAKIAMVRMTFIKHWKDPLPDCLPPLVAGYQAGMDTGDFEFASFNLYVETLIDYVIGRPLPEVAQKSAVNLQTIKELQQKSAQHFIEIYWQAALNLMGKGEMEGEVPGEVPIELRGPIYDEQVTLPKQIAANDRTGVGNVYLQKLFLSYLFYQYDQALENAQKFDEYKESARGAPNMPRFLFYRSLTFLAVAAENPANKKTLLRQVKKDLKQLSKWSKFGPNYRHYVYLLQAEWSYIHTDFNQAAEFYDKAIHHTREYTLLHEEGVANELAARFYLNRGRKKVALVYLADARYAYLRWGANAKVAHLEAHYPALTAQLTSSSKTTATITPQTSSSTAYSTDSTTGSRQGATSLDIHSIMKASQAISGEIVLETLLQKLMRTLIENAGADYGYLLLERDGTWFVEAKGAVNQEEVQTLQAIPIQDMANAPLPVSVINYVARTKENVVLNDARHEGPFIHDPYIVQNQPQSLLCFPLINQGQLSGIVYMENYLTAAVFTPQRLETLKLLSTQAAISVENARLYTNLEDSLAQQVRLTKAYGRFVPREFLYALGKESILDVKLGDQIQRDMTVLFADIRSFTSISETMSPQENFRFLNDYLEQVSPIIRQYNGFIDKYVGDAIMALFGHEPSEAIKTALALHQKVAEFNQAGKGYPAIRIGISLHYGRMMLGTVGEMERMDGTVISDSVNVAARLEDLNKVYGTNIILSAETLSQLSAEAPYQVRSLGKLLVRGKKESIQVYELLDGLPEPIRTQKEESKSLFEQAVQQYESGQLAEAQTIFAQLTDQYPDDKAAMAYLQRCRALQRHGLSTPWDITEWS